MSMDPRNPHGYSSAPEDNNLPPNSILNRVKLGNNVKPPPHLMRIFETYVENEVVNAKDLPHISFEEFGKKWLPLFNYGAHSDPSKIPLMDWVSQVAGNPYREVLLVKGGEILAVIPPIFDRLIPVMKEDDRDYFANLASVQSVIHRGAKHFAAADGYIKRNLTDRITINRRISENFHRMSEIFKLYGVERETPKWLAELDSDIEGTAVTLESKPVVSFTSGMIEED